MSVTIVIQAGHNKGKTTIASIIESALREAGFVDVTIDDEPSLVTDKEPVAQRFEAAKKRSVNIKVRTLRAQMNIGLGFKEVQTLRETLYSARTHLGAIGSLGVAINSEHFEDIDKATKRLDECLSMFDKKCHRCGDKLPYDGAKFCGSACSQLSEMGR